MEQSFPSRDLGNHGKEHKLVVTDGLRSHTLDAFWVTAIDAATSTTQRKAP